LIVDESTLPVELVVTARTAEGIPMALSHRNWPLYGVQFHPESVLTHQGRTLLGNFLDLAGVSHREALVTDWIEPPHPTSGDLPMVPW
jgi:GMP synthase-like glutamine amidotransferase